MKIVEHFTTITHHRRLVRQHCFKVGLYWQGLTHDLSKYSFREFWMGAKYYQGTRSPNAAEREDRGYSSAWLHHKGRNRHHMEYWIDYGTPPDDSMRGMKMPVRYVVEMFCDRMAASKTYRGEDYVQRDPYDYYMKSHKHYIIHPASDRLLRLLVTKLKDDGEEETFRFIREEVLKKGYSVLKTEKRRRDS